MRRKSARRQLGTADCSFEGDRATSPPDSRVRRVTSCQREKVLWNGRDRFGSWAIVPQLDAKNRLLGCCGAVQQLGPDREPQGFREERGDRVADLSLDGATPTNEVEVSWEGL